MDPITAALILGTGMQAYGMIAGANSEADAAEQDAYSKHLQAEEVERRAIIKERLLRQEGHKFIGNMASGYAKAGVEMSGSPLLAMEQANRGMLDEIEEMNRDSTWRAWALRSGASISMESAGDRRTAGWIGGIGTGLSSGALAYAKGQSTKSTKNNVL